MGHFGPASLAAGLGGKGFFGKRAAPNTANVWTKRSALPSADIAFDGTGNFVAVEGNTGGAGHARIYHSTDAKTWTTQFTGSAAQNNLSAVCFNPGVPSFVAWGNISTGNEFSKQSTDSGVTWVNLNITTPDHGPVTCGIASLASLGGIGCSGLAGFFQGNTTAAPGIAVPSTAGLHVIRTDAASFLGLHNISPGGAPAVAVTQDLQLTVAINPTAELNAAATPLDIVFTGTLYVLSDSAGEISTSASIQSPAVPGSLPWAGTVRATPGVAVNGLTFGSSTVLATLNDGTFMTSGNSGLTWTAPAASGSASLRRGCFGLGFFVIAASDGIWTYGPANLG